MKDVLALWILKLAKMRRATLAAPQGDDYNKFYEHFFEEKDVEAYEADRRMVLRRQTIDNALRQYAPPPAKVIDIGCGLGDVLAGLPDGYQLAGTDYADSNVHIAARRLGKRAAICRSSIYEMPYSNSAFDVGICLEVLEHIEDHERAAREIFRILSPRGILIAAVPYTFYWPQYLKLMGHFRHYTRESFAGMLQDAGFVIEAYLPNYPNWHQAYTRRYAAVRAQAMTIGRLLGSASLYAFRYPWQKQPALAQMADRIDWLRVNDAKLDYASLATSTFLLARKPG